MTDFVTGTSSVVGFTNDRDRHYHHNYGVTDKDQMFAVNIDANERTRDVLSAIADSVVATEKVGAANSLAIEKVGAAAELTAEKIGAAGILESAKNAAALHVQIANSAAASAAIAAQNQQAAMMYANTNASAGILFAAQNQATLAAQLAACCCEIKEGIAGVNATILAVDAHRIRDDLAEARAELLALRVAASVA